MKVERMLIDYGHFPTTKYSKAQVKTPREMPTQTKKVTVFKAMSVEQGKVAHSSSLSTWETDPGGYL